MVGVSNGNYTLVILAELRRQFPATPSWRQKKLGHRGNMSNVYSAWWQYNGRFWGHNTSKNTRKLADVSHTSLTPGSLRVADVSDAVQVNIWVGHRCPWVFADERLSRRSYVSWSLTNTWAGRCAPLGVCQGAVDCVCTRLSLCSVYNCIVDIRKTQVVFSLTPLWRQCERVPEVTTLLLLCPLRGNITLPTTVSFQSVEDLQANGKIGMAHFFLCVCVYVCV